MRSHRWLGWLLAALTPIASTMTLAACGGGDKGGAKTSGASAAAIVPNPANGRTTIVVGSKNFTEQKVLGEIFAQGLAAAGYKVRKQLDLGDEDVALKAIRAGRIDAYPEYTGTALTSFFGVKSSDIPKNPQRAFQEAKAGFARMGLTALPPTPFTSSNEVGVTQATARRYNLTSISALSPVARKLILYGAPECRRRLDCLLGIQRVYGLEFKRFVPVVIERRHEVLNKGQADVSIVFTTDPQNKRDDIVLLRDDKRMFPPYNSTLVVRDQTAKRAGPDLPGTVAKVQRHLNAPVMQELNARVDLDEKTPAEVASEYLKEEALAK
jgi:osmoprotectant transport system substrate-binding protein